MRKPRVRFEESILSRAGSVVVLLASFASGCASLDKWRGDGFKESENWSDGLREQPAPQGKAFSGLSTKANQIEHNLGVR